MTIKIGSNIASIQAQRRLAEVSTSQSGIYERLSSGQRINRASDDAASLAIASSLNAESKVFTQGIKNLNDGISALSIAESALQSLQTISVRQKELAEQAASSVYSTKQRNALQAEADALSAEYNRIVEGTSFNGRRLFQAGGQEIRLQAGVSLQDSFAIDIGAALSGTETVTATGTSTNFTLTAGGVGEQTSVGIYNPSFGGYYTYNDEISSIDLTSITPGSTFTIYDSNGQNYDFEFVSTAGSPGTGYTSISYDESWVSTDFSSLQSAIYTAFDSVGMSSYFGYSNNSQSVATISAYNSTDTSNITASGVSVSTVQEGGASGSSYNPNEGSLRFQASDGSNYYVWTRTVEDDGMGGYGYYGDNPMLPGTGIMIDIYDGYTAVTVAATISSAINSQTAGKVSASSTGSVLTILNNGTNNVTNSIGSGYLSNIYAAGTKDGQLSGQAESSRFVYQAGSTFTSIVDAQEAATITLNQTEYASDIYYTYSSEISELTISGDLTITTSDDTFTIYHNGVGYNFDFEVDNESSSNSGYHHIQISSTDSEDDIINAVANYINSYLSSEFSASRDSYGRAHITSNSDLDEIDISINSADSSLSGSVVTAGGTTTGGPFTSYPDLGAFMIYDTNGTSFSFWYDFAGAGSSDPYSGTSNYSFSITVNENDSRNTIMSNTATVLDNAINSYNAYISYVNNGSSLTISQQGYGDVSDIQSSGPEITANTTLQGSGTPQPITGLYSRFYTPSTNYYLWYRVDGTGSNPNPGGTGIQVNISSSWNSTQIASAAASAVNTALAGIVSASASGSSLTLTNAVIGPATNANVGNTTSQLAAAYTLTPGANHTYFSSTNHGMSTGDRVQYSSTGTAVGGLTSGADYYVIRDTANTFRLASSSVNALAGTSMTLTGAGTGTQSVSSYNGGTTTISNLTAITLDLSSASAAATSLDSVETQLQKINTEIANIGTYQSRLGYASAELKSRTETLQTAYSRIMSADVATESANLVRTQILQQSAASILAQANQTPALALQLLQ